MFSVLAKQLFCYNMFPEHPWAICDVPLGVRVPQVKNRCYTGMLASRLLIQLTKNDRSWLDISKKNQYKRRNLTWSVFLYVCIFRKSYSWSVFQRRWILYSVFKQPTWFTPCVSIESLYHCQLRLNEWALCAHHTRFRIVGYIQKDISTSLKGIR